jgi:hypothetical protein
MFELQSKIFQTAQCDLLLLCKSVTAIKFEVLPNFDRRRPQITLFLVTVHLEKIYSCGIYKSPSLLQLLIVHKNKQRVQAIYDSERKEPSCCHSLL